MSRLLSAMLLVAVAIVVVRQLRRRRALRDTGLSLKRRSQANRAYWFALPPMVRPK